MYMRDKGGEGSQKVGVMEKDRDRRILGAI